MGKRAGPPDGRTWLTRSSIGMGVAVLLGATLLAGCHGGPDPNLASGPYGNDHTKATTGFELGPEQFNSNGGAFGPDQLSR